MSWLVLPTNLTDTDKVLYSATQTRGVAGNLLPRCLASVWPNERAPIHHYMMKKLLSTLIAMLSFTTAQAQPVNYASSYTHHSSVLNEERQYSVYLPKEYDSQTGQHFPVLYLLDGEQHLLEVAGITDSLRGGLMPALPAMIIVAIHNTDRMRDYTPSHTQTLPNGQPAGKAYATTGGGDKFLTYLIRELRQEIEQQFRTTRPALLVGHSLGGLLALDAFTQDNDAFQGIISIDASLWFDFPRHSEQLTQRLKQKPHFPSSLFIAIANNPYTPGFGRSEFHRDQLLKFADQILQASEQKQRQTAPERDITSRYYAEEDHHSVYHLAVYHGLQWLFRGYRLDLNPTTFSLERVSANYQSLNQRFGSSLKPERNRLQALELKARLWPQMDISVQQTQALLQHYYR